MIPVQPFQIPPFNETRLFARRTPGGNYDTFVSCSPSLTPDYAGCGTTVDFEGWETTIRFSGEHLCDYDATVDQARNFLSRHVVQRTPRRQE